MERNDQRKPGRGAMSLQRCYEILELEPGAEAAEIKSAFRRLAFVWHPDRFPTENRILCSSAEEHFKQLNAAYHILMEARAFGPGEPSSYPAKANRGETGTGSVATASGFRRRAALLVGLFLMAALAAGLMTFGLRYLRIEQAHREVRTRLAVSEGKKKALLAAAKKQRAVDAALQTTKKGAYSPPLSKTATGSPASVGEDAAGRAPLTESSDPGSGHRAVRQERARIEAMIIAGRSFEQQGRFGEAQEQYLAALSRIESFDGSKSPLEKLESRVTSALASDRIRLGAAGYRLYEGRWYSPKAVRTEFVSYRGNRVHYSALQPAAERFADPLVRSHLRAVFSTRLLHKNKVRCIELDLRENHPGAASLQALYRWEVWTFEGVEKGELSLDLVYRPAGDSWEAVWLTKR